MSEKEKDIVKRVASSVSELSKEKQTYILGVVDGMVIAKESIYDMGKDKELQEV